VGAALLAPAGGLTTLGMSTAGATTNQTVQFGSPSTVKLLPFGTAILTGISCAMTATQCTLSSQITITKGGDKTIILVPITEKILVKQTSTDLVITSASVKSSSFLMKGLSFTHCRINNIPAASLAKTGTSWVATTLSMSGVTIATTGGTCTKRPTLTSDFTHKLDVSFKLSTKAI
jgi:hypothetical protein